MKHFPKRIIAWLLALMLLLTLLPTAAFAARQDVWKQIAAYEKAHLRRTRGVDDERTAADYATLSEGIAKLVTSSTDYRFGTCTYDGRTQTASHRAIRPRSAPARTAPRRRLTRNSALSRPFLMQNGAALRTQRTST